jgi:type II secretory pathway component PulL
MKPSASLVASSVTGKQDCNLWGINVGKTSQHPRLKALIHALFLSGLGASFVQLWNDLCVVRESLPDSAEIWRHRPDAVRLGNWTSGSCNFE